MSRPRHPSGPMLAAAAVPLLLLFAAGAGCSSTSDPATGDLRLDLRHRDPRVRIIAAERIATEGRDDLAPDLVSNLADPDGAVRLFTAVALRKLTGRDFGYTPYGAPAEQEAAIRGWREWLEAKEKAREDAREEAKANEDSGGAPAGGEARKTGATRDG